MKSEKQDSLKVLKKKLRNANNGEFNTKEFAPIVRMIEVFSNEVVDSFLLRKEEENFFMVGVALFTKKGIAKCLVSKFNEEISDYLHFIPFRSIYSIRFSLNGKIESDKQENEFMITFSRGGDVEDNVYFKCETKDESLRFLKRLNDLL